MKSPCLPIETLEKAALQQVIFTYNMEVSKSVLSQTVIYREKGHTQTNKQ